MTKKARKPQASIRVRRRECNYRFVKREPVIFPERIRIRGEARSGIGHGFIS